MTFARRTIAALALVLAALAPAVTTARMQPPPASVRVEVRSGRGPVAGAEVLAGASTGLTGADGVVTLAVPRGDVTVTVVKNGFVPLTLSVQITDGARRDVIVELLSQPEIEESVIVVATTRTGGRLDDQPMRVEVLEREAIEEKMLMTPGDIVMMLNEMGGMRVQATSPSLGAASVRIQGQRGRHTRVLSDGLPLYGEVGGLGLLQIPPMDLGQVEVIKGVASALYGAGAMGGVVNLLTRRPGQTPRVDTLVNQSTRGATDAVAFVSRPLGGRWSATWLGGGHWQRVQDVNGDGWSDLSGYRRAVLRPRLFWEGERGANVFLTGGATLEDREGGAVDGRSLPGLGRPYIEALDTRRFDAGATGQFLLTDLIATVRASYVHQRHHHRFGDVVERDLHDTAFAELAVRGGAARQTWVVGVALERDAYRPLDVPRFAYTFFVPGVFAQWDVAATPTLSLSSSVRLDAHSEYGTFVSPRVSLRARHGGWTSRASVGTGFFAPTPLTEESEAAGLHRLTIDSPLEAERGLSGSLDLSRTTGPVSYTLTLFGSRITRPLRVERTTVYRLVTLTEPTTTVGVELLGTWRREPFAVTSTYTYVRTHEDDGTMRTDLALTPRHSAGVVAMWERENVGRAGLEWYYTGRQRLEDNPFRAQSEPYAIVGALVERQVGLLRVFLNGENLTGVRQTRWEPLLRPVPGGDGRWTVDAWAPLDGRTFNGGVRMDF